MSILNPHLHVWQVYYDGHWAINPIRTCRCSAIQVFADGKWIKAKPVHRFGGHIWILTTTSSRYTQASSYLRDRYDLDGIAIHPLIDEQDWGALRNFAMNGQRPALVPHPEDWYESPLIQKPEFLPLCFPGLDLI